MPYPSARDLGTYITLNFTTDTQWVFPAHMKGKERLKLAMGKSLMWRQYDLMGVE